MYVDHIVKLKIIFLGLKIYKYSILNMIKLYYLCNNIKSAVVIMVTITINIALFAVIIIIIAIY